MARLGRACHRRRWLVLTGWLVALIAGGAASVDRCSAACPPTTAQRASSRSPRTSCWRAGASGRRDGPGGDGRGGPGLCPYADKPSRPWPPTWPPSPACGGWSIRTGRPPGPSTRRPTSPATAARCWSRRCSTNPRPPVRAPPVSSSTSATADTVAAVAERLRAGGDDLPGATVRLGGDELMNEQVFELVAEDLLRGEAVLATDQPTRPRVRLRRCHRGRAAGAGGDRHVGQLVPGAAGASAAFVELDANVPTIVSLLALGLSIDYGLLLVARYREELAGGADPGGGGRAGVGDRGPYGGVQRADRVGGARRAADVHRRCRRCRRSARPGSRRP